MAGKFFVVRSPNTGLVLSIVDSVAMPNQPVVTWSYTGADNQVWFIDPITETIRTKLDDSYCLDIDGSRLVINFYRPENNNQKWSREGSQLVNAALGMRVLGVENSSDAPGANIMMEDSTGNPTQNWKFEHRPPAYFYIKSYVHGKVLDVKGEKAEAGAAVIVYDKKDTEADNQLWWEDIGGVIRSKIGDLAIELSAKDGKTASYDSSKPQQQLVKSGNKIVQKDTPNKCLDIKGESKKSGAAVCQWQYKGSENQHWYFDYV